MDAVHLSVDRFCLLAGVEALAEMMEEDATTVCGARHRRHGDRRGYRWGRTHSEIGYHGGKVKVARPRVRDRAGKEVSLESWQALRDGNLLLEWALNLMVLNVSTRKYHRAVRLPEGDLAKARGDGTSKSAVSRRFVALSRKKMKAWLASDLSELDLLVIQIDGLHVGDHVLMAAIGVDRAAIAIAHQRIAFPATAGHRPITVNTTVKTKPNVLSDDVRASSRVEKSSWNVSRFAIHPCPLAL